MLSSDTTVWMFLMPLDYKYLKLVKGIYLIFVWLHQNIHICVICVYEKAKSPVHSHPQRNSDIYPELVLSLNPLSIFISLKKELYQNQDPNMVALLLYLFSKMNFLLSFCLGLIHANFYPTEWGGGESEFTYLFWIPARSCFRSK